MTNETAGSALRNTITLALIVALLAPGVAAFGPAFNGPPGWRAAGGGVAVGVLVAVLAAWRRLGIAPTAAAAVVAYLLFGAAFALPRTTVAGVLPTLDSLQRLALLVVQSWRDLLTVTTPADRFTGPTVVPFLAGLVSAVVTGSLTWRSRRPLCALAPPLVLLVVALAWGTTTPFAPGWLAAGLVGAAMAYGGWQRHLTRRRNSGELVVAIRHRGHARLVVAALTVVALGATAVWAAPVLPGPSRHVLRELTEPPLDLRSYASPLTNYRHWEVDLQEETLFTVTGLPAGQRLRIATLDTFDGNVYSLAPSSASFVRAGDRLDGADSGTPTELDITVGEYAGIWLPGTGVWRGIDFTGPHATTQVDTLYHSAPTTTAISTAGIASGDRLRVLAEVPATADRAELAEARTAVDRLPRAAQPPSVVAETAQDFSGDAATAMAQLSRLEQRLREGYYSNGSDGKSRPGHTSERIATLLSGPQLIGDDEQYAVAMALMARELGHPARVVLGFYPDPKEPAPAGPWAVRGAEAHVWVEVDFGAPGWVTFDPTPDRDRIPNTEVPRPQPKPKPQVPPPPQPPRADAEDLVEVASNDPRTGERANLAVLFLILQLVLSVLGVGAALAAPFLLIWAAKTRRRQTRRRATELADGISGSWDDLLDIAIDLGHEPPTNGTRLDEARSLVAAYPHLNAVPVAQSVDTHVYGPMPPGAEAVDRTWAATADLADALRTSQPPWRRLLGFCSLRSFWRGRGVPRRGRRTS